jgi:galactose mutarotase-like enzyme
MNGVEMLSMENRRLKVVFALGKGADIVEFVYKPLDVDCMWHSFNELKNATHIPTSASPGGTFLDVYAGGWQELCPTYGGNTVYHGAPIGVHGEACLYPWDCAIVEDMPERIEVRLTLRLIRSPFALEKTAALEGDGARLTLRQRITNVGAVEQDFMWGHHPAFGYPFLDESVRIRVSGAPDVTVPASAIAHRCPFDRETSGKWPVLPDSHGQPLDLSRAHAPEDRLYMEYCLYNLAEGKYELVNQRLGLGFRLRFDEKVFPYLWVWGLYCGIDEYPWYGRSYVLAVEPWSSMPGDYEAARKAGAVLKLAPGASMETRVCAEAFLTGED